MSARRSTRLKSLMLLALGLFLVNAACMNMDGPSETGPPTVDGKTHTPGTVVDDGDDGPPPDDFDAGPVTTGAATPVQISLSAAGGHDVSFELNTDTDTFEVNCAHQLDPSAASETECFGPVFASFPIDVLDGNAEFDATFAIFAAPNPGAEQLTQDVDATVEIECGAAIQTADLGTSSNAQALLSVPVGPAATACNVEVILINSRVISPGGVDATVVQAVKVNARNVAAIGCANAVECPDELEFCNQFGECQAGKEGEPGSIPELHCDGDPPAANELSECSDRDAGSLARGLFECKPEYTFNGSICEGTPCASDADCGGDTPICTVAGCSATGVPGDGCSTNEACRSGLCLGKVCFVLLGEGGNCILPFGICTAGLACFVSGTCEQPLAPGSSCEANRECQDAPPGANSCIAATCFARSSLGGPCDVGDNDDCLPGFSCDAGTCAF